MLITGLAAYRFERNSEKVKVVFAALSDFGSAAELIDVQVARPCALLKVTISCA
jgi:hypothetical protein